MDEMTGTRPEENDLPEIPIEEFTLDELDEDTPPEEFLSPEPEEPEEDPEPVWETPPVYDYEEPPEIEEEPAAPHRRPRLLDRKGRLARVGWDTEDVYEYNKEKIRLPFRRKEWEFYQLSNSRFTFQVTYGHTGYASLASATLVDFATGERFTSGKQGNVDLSKRVIVFDIHELGSQLKPTGLLVITDTILNRVSANWKTGKRTHVFLDEFHVLYENEYSAQFFGSAWRQFRKRNAYPTAITQNVEYLRESGDARAMLSNSEFIVMLNQAEPDRETLSKLLAISNEQLSYITNAEPGSGLIRYGSSLVPFVNRFPKDTEIYRMITTKPGEGAAA